MIISLSNILHFIASQKPDLNIYGSAINSDIEVEDISSTKSRILHLTISDENQNQFQLFVKQALDIQNKNETFSINREAFFYETCYKNNFLKNLLPNDKYFLFNNIYSILIREWIIDVNPFSEIIKQNPPINISKYLEEIGGTLGEFHNNLSLKSLKSHRPKIYSKLLALRAGRPSPFLSLGIPNIDAFLSSKKPKFYAFISDIYRKLLIEKITKINHKWQETGIIHSDINTPNVLIQDNNRNQKAWIVDWEFAVFGDYAWDISSFIFNFILIQQKTYDIESQTKSNFQLFWKNYYFTLKLKYLNSDDFKEKTFVFIGIMLLQKVMIFSDSEDSREREQVIVLEQIATKFILSYSCKSSHHLLF